MRAVPCQHIADYYHKLWEGHKCIAWNFLRIGYRQWAEGKPSSVNNLYKLPRRRKAKMTE